MRRSILLFVSLPLAAALFGCDDPGPPAPTPDRFGATSAASSSAPSTASAAVSAAPSAQAPAEATADPAPSGSASAEPSAVASSSAAPSASASGAAVAKGFSFPSPKSGILSPSDADKLIAVGARPKVRVLDPGSDPPAKVSYAPSKGDKVGLRLDFTMKIALSAAGQPTPAIVVPPQTVDADVQVEDADEANGALVAMVMRKISVQPKDSIDQDTADALTKQLAGLSGYTLRERVSARGAQTDVKTEVPAAAPKGAEQLLSTLASTFHSVIPALPDEPIGTGAKWQVLSRDDSTGTSLVELDEYTLKDRSGNKLTVELSGRQLAASDTIKLPTGMPEGVSTKLAKFATTLSGSFVIDTKQIGPVKGRLSHDSKLTINVSAPGQDKVKADVSLKTNASIGRRSGGAAASSAEPSAAPSAAPKDPAP